MRRKVGEASFLTVKPAASNQLARKRSISNNNAAVQQTTNTVTNPNLTHTTEDGFDFDESALEARLQQLASQSEVVGHIDKLKKKATGKSRVVQLNLMSEDTFHNRTEQTVEETATL